MVRHFLYEHEHRKIFMLEFAIARLANKIPQPILDPRETGGNPWPEELWHSFADSLSDS